MSSEETVGACTDATVSSNATLVAGRAICASSPAWPFVRAAQQVFMLGELLQQIVKCGFDRRRRSGSRFLYCHLPRRKAQIQRHCGAFAGGILLNPAFQMHQFRAKHLQALAQLFYQVVDFFFDVGSFLDLVADVDVHSQTSEYGSRSREALRVLQGDSTPCVEAGECKLRLRCFAFVSFLRGVAPGNSE